MRIVLVAMNAQYIHTNLAVRCIQAYLKQANIDTEIIECTINNRQQHVLRRLFEKQADVYLFSCYIWNITEMCVLAEELHKLLPQAFLAAGGPQVSYHSKGFLRHNKAFNAVVVGEGEEACLQLCSALLGRKSLQECPCLVYRNKQEEITITQQQPPLAMAGLPFAYAQPNEFEGRIMYYESMRGCPFGCSYCLSSAQGGVRFKPMKKTLDELTDIVAAKPKQVKFVDRTFNCDKKHAMAIWAFLKQHDNGVTNFHFELAGELLNEEMLVFLADVRPGLFQFEIGVQTTNIDTLHEINRPTGLQVLFKNVQKLQQAGNIHLHLDLIAGLPHEDFASFANSFNEVMKYKPHQMQLGFLKVLPGTEMQTNAGKYGLVWESSAPFEVLYTKWIGYQELTVLKGVADMVELYYNSGRFAAIVQHIGSMFEDAFAFWRALADFYEENGHNDAPLGKTGHYQLLGDFMLRHKLPQTSHAKWLCRYDLLLHEKPKTVPRWVDVDGARPNRDRVLLFYEQGENKSKFVNEYDGKTPKQIINMAHIEVFPFHPQTGEERECALLFNYKRRGITGRAYCTEVDLPIVKKA